ncbi:MAG: hypothetical protein PHS46_08580 [Candidatus Omnitrophica bacterium]|nr:hypothetical protein [Candidatus Omnitrophota bacterium]
MFKCCMCGKYAVKIMEGFTLCSSHDCYIKAHLPGYGLTVAIYVILILGAFVLGGLGLSG